MYNLSAIVLLTKINSCPGIKQNFFSCLTHYVSPGPGISKVLARKIKIIGMWINFKDLSISPHPDKKLKLVEALCGFANDWNKHLRAWWQISGWSSWAFNIFAYGRWALQTKYDKLAHKDPQGALVPHNTKTVADLNWLADALEKWEGLFLIWSGYWSPKEVCSLFHCNAYPARIGAWEVHKQQAHHLSLPPPSRDIF